MSEKITAFKVLKEGKKAEIEFSDIEGLSSDSKECRYPVHPDLMAKIQSLAMHLAVCCGYCKPKDVRKYDLEPFVVTGFSISYKEDNDGLTIKGYRRCDKGIVPLNTPFMLFNEDPATRYPLMADIQQKLHDTFAAGDGPVTLGILSEVELYRRREKIGKDGLEQTEMQFPEGEGDEGEEGAENGSGAKITRMQVAPPRPGIGDLGNIPDADPEAMNELAKETFGGK